MNEYTKKAVEAMEAGDTAGAQVWAQLAHAKALTESNDHIAAHIEVMRVHNAAMDDHSSMLNRHAQAVGGY